MFIFVDVLHGVCGDHVPGDDEPGPGVGHLGHQRTGEGVQSKKISEMNKKYFDIFIYFTKLYCL